MSKAWGKEMKGTSASSAVDKKIDLWKSQLIDLSKRNRLLYFRQTKRGSVQLIQPGMEEIFDWLVRKAQPMTFVDNLKDNAEVPFPSSIVPIEKHPEIKPGELLTSLNKGELDKVLYNLYLRSRTSIQERGVNILFVAFGFLEWRETQYSDQKLRSPLILVPVELLREGVAKPYKLSVIDEEVILNPALVQKMNRDFDIDLPTLPEDLDEFKLYKAFEQIRQVVSGLDWEIIAETYLGLFSFTKLVMYKDLETHIDHARSHPIIATLAGDRSKLPPIPEDLPPPEKLDDLVPPEESFQVLDADSSQQEAIIAAKRGVSFVLQGPPGTGKSQTITNIIAECLAAGKTVLFVSEKMAALEVVKKRLDNCGLGQFCLELHSHKANKRVIIEELRKALDTPPIKVQEQTFREELNSLKDRREKLNSYVRTLHKPRSKLQLTPYKVHGRLARFQNAPDLAFKFSNILKIDHEQFQHINSLLKRLATLPEVFEHYYSHPWHGCQAKSFSFQLQSDIQNRFERLKRGVEKLEKAAGKLADMVGVGKPKTFEEVKDLVSLLSSYNRGILSLNLSKLISRFEISYSSSFRFLKLDYHRDIKTLQNLARSKHKIQYNQALEDLKLAKKVLDSLGLKCNKGRSPLPDIKAELDLIYRLNSLIRKIEKKELSFLTRIYPGLLIEGRPVEQATFSALKKWLQIHLDNLDKLREWVDFQKIKEECEKVGLTNFILTALRKRLKANQLESAFYKRFYQLWLDAVCAQDDVLRNFNSNYHQTIIEEFRELDKRQLQIAKLRIQQKLAERRPQTYWVEAPSSEQTILRHEIAKKRRHKPIRKLFSQIPNLLLALKPCLLMSPLSVSQFLDPKIFKFDIVIFDEASQICPEDAIGAIMRGKQLIVVGDSKQLPPTRFFMTMGIEDFEDEELAEMEILESILDECVSIGLPTMMLLWHYRSRHESLIAFSNYHFYDNRLNTFPSALHSDAELGIEFVYIPNGIYDRGKSRRNVIEARKVAELVFRHFDKFPERSLGVVAFSEAQQIAILEEIERLRLQRPEYEAFFDESRDEPFFVKNLENVQGDERDVIFFSVGYGKDAAGRMSMNFGPLNTEGGQRRLNVAITRARYHIKLIASILPTDIDLSRTESPGVKLLHNYMEYARRKGDVKVLSTQLNVNPDRDFESPFEEEVYRALTEELGLTVHKQVGCSGYRIDLAIVDPKNPGRYLLGIECDGATYHSAKTARDRDRLRQQILENLGWRIHRIWSRDWIENPKRELQKIIEAINTTPQRASTENNVETSLETQEEPPPPKNVFSNKHQNSLPKGVVYYRTTPILWKENPEDFYSAPIWNITTILVKVVECEGPIHLKAATRRVAEFWGIKRVGARIQKIVSEAIRNAYYSGRIKIKGDFLWPVDKEKVPVRTTPPGETPRDVEEIALEEIAEAACLCLENAFSMTIDDLITQTARLLGYSRAGQKAKSRILLAIQKVLLNTDIIEINDRNDNIVRLKQKNPHLTS